MAVPHLFDLDEEEADVMTEGQSPLNSQISYESIHLGSDFAGFFANDVDSIIIRDEYRHMLQYITGLCEDGERGVVLTGQSGIGKIFIARSEYI